MKANQKFRNSDDGVSPVIAVILMVAITVVLAATVYVWVSGFGAQSSQPAKSVSLTSASALANGNKTYTVASATSGMKWNDISLTLDGVTLAYDGTQGSGGLAANEFCVAFTSASCSSNATWAGTGAGSGSSVIQAGQTVVVHDGASLSGRTLRVLDSQANAVMLTLTVG